MCYSPEWIRECKAASPTTKQGWWFSSNSSLGTWGEDSMGRTGEKESRGWRGYRSSSTAWLLFSRGLKCPGGTGWGLLSQAPPLAPYSLVPGCSPKICQNRCHLKWLLIRKSKLKWSVWKACPHRDNGRLTSVSDKQVWGSQTNIFQGSPVCQRACSEEG